MAELSGTMGTGDGGGGGGGGSGGGGGGYLDVIRRNMPQLLTHEIRQLVDTAVRQSWSIDEFLSHVYASDTFVKTFPGIFRKDGTLRMNPAEYLSAYGSYRELAQAAGVKLDKDTFGDLIGGDTSIAEFQDRLAAVKSVSDNKIYLEAFRDTLKSMGISTKGLDTPEEFAAFVMGQGTKHFYNLYEQLNVRGAAGEQGIDQLSKKTTKYIAGKGLDPAALEAGFTALAHDLSTLMPASQLAGLGISKKDLVVLEFGGANREAIRKRAEQISKNYEGYFKDRGQVRTATGNRGKSLLYGQDA